VHIGTDRRLSLVPLPARRTGSIAWRHENNPPQSSPTNPLYGLIPYTTDDDRGQIKLRAQETVWLTQLEMAEIFDATKQNISRHLQNIFQAGELDERSVVKDSLTISSDGKRYPTAFYNLNAEPFAPCLS
jgi:hypothetical protein